MNARIAIVSRRPAAGRARVRAESKGQLRLPEFAALADKASESVNVTLDSKLLGMGCRFLNAEDPEAGRRQEARARRSPASTCATTPSTPTTPIPRPTSTACAGS